MKTTPRWLKAVIAATAEARVALPWTRGARRRPAAVKVAPRARALAAR